MILICFNRLLIIFTSIFIHLQISGAHQIKYCLIGEPITLDCTFRVPSGSRIRDISVLWEFLPSKSKLFQMEHGNTNISSPGYVVNMDGLLKGNASLHLESPALTDEGEFRCNVVAFPDVWKRSSVTLYVSVRPSLSLTKRATVLNGEKTTLSCKVTGFYPKAIEVQWLPNVSMTDVCTSSSIPNSDYTYNLTSHLSIQGDRIVNHEAIYICQIKHRSFDKPQNQTVHLSVIETPQDPVAMIITAVVSSVVLVSFILAAAVVVFLHFHTPPPSISDISTPSVIYANTRADIKCTVRQVKLKHVDVQWYKVLSNGGGHQEEPPMEVQRRVCRQPLENQALFSELEERETQLEHLTENIQVHSDDAQLVSILSLCPTVSDDGGRYRCVVSYKGQTHTRETMLRVKTQPSFLQISSVPPIPTPGQQVVLCCRVERFYPAQIRLEWWGPCGEQLLGPVVQYGPFSDYQGLHSVWSTTELTITSMEEGLVYMCRAYHSSFPEPGYRDLPYRVNLKGTPPTVKFIKCDPAEPQVGQECTLSLCVEDFSPDSLSVSWFRNGEPMPTGPGVFNSPASLNPSGLFSQWAFLRLVPTLQDLGAVYRCQVGHSALAQPEERNYTLNLTLE